ncbi:MAG: hypothetical protein NUW37_02575 [Planctomycetes bacterium]|nr:hypothetical protein [Planctomycetota bacterium]
MIKTILIPCLLSTTIFGACASSAYDPANYVDRAVLYYGSKDYARSLDQAERAIELEEDNVTAWNIRGWSLYFLGHISKTDAPEMNATECFRHITREIDTGAWEAWYGLSSCFMKEIRDYEQEYSDVLGMKEMIKILGRFRSADTLYEADYIELDESLPRFQQFIEHLKSKQLVFTEQRHQSVVGSPAAQLLALETATPEALTYPYFWGAYLKQSEYDEFMYLYSREDADIVATKVDRVLRAFEVAGYEAHLEWIRKFIEDRSVRMRNNLDKVVELNPDYVRAHQLRSSMLLLLMNLEYYKNNEAKKLELAREARTHLEKFANAWLESVDALTKQSEKLTAQYFTVGAQEYKAAILHQRDVVDDDLRQKKKELAESFKSLAFLCSMLGDNLIALGYLDNSITMRTGDPQTYFQRGQVYRDLAETTKAIEDFRMVREIVLADHPLFADASDEIDRLVKRSLSVISVEQLIGKLEYKKIESTVFAEARSGLTIESGVDMRTSLNSEATLFVFGFFKMTVEAGTTLTIGKCDLSIQDQVYFEIDVSAGSLSIRLNDRTVEITSDHHSAVIVVDTIGLDWSSVRIDLGADGSVDRDISNSRLNSPGN